MKRVKGRKITNSKKAMLVTAILTSLISAPSWTEAAEEADTWTVSYGGIPVAELNILHQDEGLGYEGDYFITPAEYELDESLVKGSLKALYYWTDMLSLRGKNSTPWQIYVTTQEDLQNASALSNFFTANGTTDKMVYPNTNYITESFQGIRNLTPITFDLAASEDPFPAGDYAYSRIIIGKYMGAHREGAIDGWWVDGDTVLPTNEHAADYIAIFRHELGHALGIAINDVTTDENGEELSGGNIPVNDKNEYYKRFDDSLNNWSSHLVDQNLNPAKPGMQIMTSDFFNDLKKDHPEVKESDYFIVDNGEGDNGDNLTGRQGYAFFIGSDVTAALDGGTFYGVNGLPVKGWEKEDGIFTFEGSHIETAGIMSHRSYRNYTTFLEAELAVMNDIGYDIDRKAYYGRSIYNNGRTLINTQGYFARNADGTAYLNNTFSKVPLGIGLHIYGYDNNITQAANILTVGDGGTGVRVDGVNNTLIIPENTEIHADGYRGNGILVAYGRNHTVNQAGTVTANGEGGTGIRFDFGSNLLGAPDSEYRGSYIRYSRDIDDDGNITEAENLKLTKMDSDEFNSVADELNGPMVDNYNLSGTLSGDENAIYIGKNAFVKNININDGAKIYGNITSDWKQFGDAAYEGAYDEDEDNDNRDVLRLQYKGNFGKNGYWYSDYIPDLVTNLNFNTNLTYNGDITGEDNMKVNVNNGTLTYNGTANVVSVNVAEDAALYGGNFIVNEISDDDFASDFTDDTTGNFYNYGSIGANSENSNMNIEGNLVSNGELRGFAGGDNGQIIVDGKASINGSMLSVTNALPNEQMEVLQADEIEGTLGNTTKPYAATGMLNTIGIIDGTTLKVTTSASNNLGPIDSTQQQAYDAMTDMQLHLSANGDGRVNEMRDLYSMDSGEAKAALTAIASSPAPNNMVMTQSNTMTSHLLSARLSEAFASKEVKVAIPTSKLDDGKDDKALTMDMKLAQPVDNDFWFKVARNWGEGSGSSYYQGTTMAGGWDRAYGKHWRAGAFVSYGQFSFADNLSHNGVKDTRVGLYGGYSNGPHNGYVYLDYGWINNDLTRRLTGLDLQAKADYNSRILELGGEYKYDLNAKNMKIWHISPYANVQLSQLWQDGYTERGAGIFGHRVDSQSNTYFAGGLGLEFKRYLSKGSYALRLGVKHAFTGADPKFTYGYVGNDTKRYELRGQQDKTHFIMSIGGEAEFAPGWTLAGDLAFQKGSHDKDIMASVTFRRMW
ncbi:Uncharacterized conserved protein, contains a C-terminal beta-barrel porin domain [Anaerovibrio lipolyticus DSM 3074]|uniref:Uncharacterized conserved protein, contains a C-terminal beta-barrel porin domain n=1 Tax=Anaerovibrio lipolyticus DSM 3074 TaxID=1120997 RepID=A0A1M6CSK0_9FIRM|nr:autotransporter domain-containing protein [Anaerovibrio lipolyticus]SHI63992.1 Uncharacterized conserved protein, contains a C-terminal beta-barrel porin domain [Anaerovibrio lipolyticus DSM 3074]